MTTDVTELTQRRDELSNPAVGGKDHLRKLALSLVSGASREIVLGCDDCSGTEAGGRAVID